MQKKVYTVRCRNLRVCTEVPLPFPIDQFMKWGVIPIQKSVVDHGRWRTNPVLFFSSDDIVVGCSGHLQLCLLSIPSETSVVVTCASVGERSLGHSGPLPMAHWCCCARNGLGCLEACKCWWAVERDCGRLMLCLIRCQKMSDKSRYRFEKTAAPPFTTTRSAIGIIALSILVFTVPSQ